MFFSVKYLHNIQPLHGEDKLGMLKWNVVNRCKLPYKTCEADLSCNHFQTSNPCSYLIDCRDSLPQFQA